MKHHVPAETTGFPVFQQIQQLLGLLFEQIEIAGVIRHFFPFQLNVLFLALVIIQCLQLFYNILKSLLDERFIWWRYRESDPGFSPAHDGGVKESRRQVGFSLLS